MVVNALLTRHKTRYESQESDINNHGYYMHDILYFSALGYALALWQHFSDCLGALGFELVPAQVDGGQRPIDQHAEVK